MFDWYFRVFVGIFITSFKVASYIVIAIVQAIWYTAHNQRHKVGDAFGDMGRGITNSLADFMKTLFK